MMLQGWDFLLAEIWVLLLIALLAGLLIGWLIWGRRPSEPFSGLTAELTAMSPRERERLAAKARGEVLDDLPPMTVGARGYVRPSALARANEQEAAAHAITQPAPSSPPAERPLRPAQEQGQPGHRPQGLSEPLDGLPDDLTKISGIGPKLAQLCNDLGFWHYDQIAAWTEAEVAWVDDNLEGFHGRVSRDGWVEQAKALAKNEVPSFRRQ